MLDRLRKRIEDLLGSSSPQSTFPEEPSRKTTSSTAQPAATPGPAVELQARLARREALRREARLMLTERIHNRLQTLVSEARNHLLQEFHGRLEDEGGPADLAGRLQFMLAPALTRELDTTIERQTEAVLGRLWAEFRGQGNLESILPSPSGLAGELRAYRDQILRAHLLDQIEVFALPAPEGIFPRGKAPPEEMRAGMASYWRSCRAALDRFFQSEEMTLLNGARQGVRLDPSLIRERLLAAQYRNGYRWLEGRLLALYGTLAELQMGSSGRLQKEKAAFDRRVVDEVLVPLAFFIRDRSEPEPLEALRSRAGLFREVVDKLVTSSEPFVQTAEALKPLLRRSVEQARPLALESFPYLRSAIDSLKGSEIHRATALLQLFEAFLSAELDENLLEAVEQNVRLNKSQYQLYLRIARQYPRLLGRLQPFERIQPSHCEFLLGFLARNEPSLEAAEDMFQQLGYLPAGESVPEDPRALLRALAVLTLSRQELAGCRFLYEPVPPSPENLKELADPMLRHLEPTGIGSPDRQSEIGAVPPPLSLHQALAATGYVDKGGDPLLSFKRDIKKLVESGQAQNLARALELIRNLRRAAEEELSSSKVGREYAPYVSEVWPQALGALVGLLFYREPGFGEAPIEKIIRPAGAEADREAEEEKIRRQISHQALIYHAFHKLLGREIALSPIRRKALPAYLKITYERLEPTAYSLLSHLRNARLLLKRIEELAALIGEADPEAGADLATVGQILSGFQAKVEELQKEAEKASSPTLLARALRELERLVRYLNIILLHSVNPWLARQTRGLALEFEFKENEVMDAMRLAAPSHGVNWEQDVRRIELHPIKGTLGCRALLHLAEGSKVLFLEYDRRQQEWAVKHFGPRLTDVLRESLKQFGRSLPDDYDEKFEQPAISLEETSCRFLLVKKGVARVEATLVLEPSRAERPWEVVFLRWNEEVLIDRTNPPVELKT